MPKRILVIFESETPSPEAIRYASELTRRMDGELVLLQLVRGGTDQDGEARRMARDLRGTGLVTTFETKDGDPRSELIKYMATRPAFLAVVWGGPDDVILEQGRASAHWLALVRDELGCPLVTMQKKKDEQDAMSGDRGLGDVSRRSGKAGR